MADILADVKTYLKTKAAITAVIGSGDDAKIYLHDAKQDQQPPYIVIDQLSGFSHEHLSAISGMAESRIQIDCYGVTRSAAHSLAELVRLAPLQMHRGTIGSSTVRTVSSNGGYRSGFDPPIHGSAQKRYWVSRDYIITHTEATS